ncbi:hypothetical protein ACWEK5_33550 [Rhodococcus koreensis]
MTTWTLWLGALLVVGGSASLITHRDGAARALWLLAVLAFAAAAASVATAAEISLPLVLAVVVAIGATLALVAVTKEPKKSAVAGRGAE